MLAILGAGVYAFIDGNHRGSVGIVFVQQRHRPRQWSAFTLVHDYNGLAEWMQGRWRTKDAVVRGIIAACQRVASARKMSIAFHHQRGHQAVSHNEFAWYNARADALATAGGQT